MQASHFVVLKPSFSSVAAIVLILLLCSLQTVAAQSATGINPSEGAPNRKEVDTSGSAEARTYFDNGRVVLQGGDLRRALDLFHRAVEADPNYSEAWLEVGSLHITLHNVADGLDEIKRAIALDPKKPEYYKAFAIALMNTGSIVEALDAWSKVKQMAPEDEDAPKQIAAILVGMGRFADAIPVLELLTNHRGGSPFLAQLGIAYARVGQKEKAVATFQQAARLDPSVASLNGLAYFMTEEHLDLDLALQYGKQAVQEQENETARISLERPTYEDVRGMAELGGDWDTLGWTHFALNHLDEAEKYLRAAWSLYESPTIGDHLAQILEKEGKKIEAMQTFARVVAQGNTPDESMAHLTALAGDETLAEREVETARSNFASLHFIQVDLQPGETSRAEFFLLFRKGSQPPDVKFIGGSALPALPVGPTVNFC